MPVNDNHFDGAGPQHAAPDPHGHAALTLVESLLHGLMERDVLTRSEAVEIVGTASDVHADIADADGGAASPNGRAHALLVVIEHSLQRDLEAVRARDGDGRDGHDGSGLIG